MSIEVVLESARTNRGNSGRGEIGWELRCMMMLDGNI